MNGRRDDDGSSDDARRDDVPTGRMNEPTDVQPGADVIAELMTEDPEVAAALEALPAALGPVDLPAGAWDRLKVALADLGSTVADPTVSTLATVSTVSTTSAVSSTVSSTVSGGGTEAPAAPPIGIGGSATPRPAGTRTRGRPGWGWAHPLTWLAAAAVAAVVVGLGTWGVVQASERARLFDEQRVLAYWMANPDIRMVPLQAVGPAEAAGAAEPASAVPDHSGRLGVVCILPDGRALLLQPAPAGRGQSYVVVSRATTDAAGAESDLAMGTGNVIRFDLGDTQRVVIMVASRDGGRVPIAWADVN